MRHIPTIDEDPVRPLRIHKFIDGNEYGTIVNEDDRNGYPCDNCKYNNFNEEGVHCLIILQEDENYECASTIGYYSHYKRDE